MISDFTNEIFALYGRDIIYYEGYCNICEKRMLFSISQNSENNVNYRESQICLSCNLNSRQRFVFSRVKDMCCTNADTSIYIYEYVTDFYKVLAKKHRNIQGSEYVSPESRPGEIVNGIRHEDALSLSFSDASFDAIISNDVYEHIPDINLALKEAFRVLKDNGRLIISIPFHISKENTIVRSKIVDGKLVNLLECQYHGNPMSDDGSLVFYDFGWDFLEKLRKVGFRDVCALRYYSEENAYFGGYFTIIEALK